MISLIDSLKPGDPLPTPPTPRPEADIMADWQSAQDRPLVSIICHSFNHADYIEHAVNGCLSQVTDFPFELIINDDASTDGTREILERYAEQYPSIVRLSLQDENQYSRGIKPITITYPLARGKYVAMCEGDDYWLDSNKLQAQADELGRDPEAVISYHDAIVVDDANRYRSMNLVERSGYTRAQLAKAPFIPTLTRFFRRVDIEWWQDNSLPVAMDIALSSYLSRHGGAVYTSGITPSVYRQHPGGVWSKKGKMAKKRITVDSLMFISSKYAEEDNNAMRQYFIRRAMDELYHEVEFFDLIPLLMQRGLRDLKRRLASCMPGGKR